MNKIKVQNRALWLGLIALGLVAVAGGVLAYSGGSVQNLTENGDINVYNTISGGGPSGETLAGAAIASDASHLGQEPKPTALSYLFLSNDLEVDGSLWTDGALRVSSTLEITGESLFAGAVTLGGSVLNETEVGPTTTMSAADFCDDSWYDITATSTALDVQLAGTSTLFTDCLNLNGRSHKITMYNASTTAAVSTIWAGSGMTLIGSPSSTANVQDTWIGGDYKNLECIRHTGNEVVCQLSTARDAD